MKRHTTVQRTALLLLLLLQGQAQAMDAFEYQVYDAEINKPGQYSLETHLNSNLSGKNSPDYSGELNANHLTHLTFEFARGMTKSWELGSYLQTALGEDGVYRYAGVKLRSKFVCNKDNCQGLGPFQFGVNFEISNVPQDFEQDSWGSEIRPIIGYSVERWTILFNPIIDMDLTVGSSATPDLNPALKTSFDTQMGFAMGLEYDTELGELNKMQGFDRAEQYLFATYDLLNGPFELNLGLGAGLTSRSNPTIAKGIFGFTF